MTEENPSSSRRGDGEPVEALGGPTAARVLGEAAAMVEVVAGAAARSWDQAGGAIAQAAALRRRALELAGVDEEAHAGAIDVLRRRAQLDPERRDWEIGKAVSGAAEPPLELTEIAADLAGLAAEVADHCDADLRADAVSACLLADAAGRVAMHLLDVNLTTGPNDERVAAGRRARQASQAATERALPEIG